jgi:ATP-binding cassette subfamily B multidrug efflux pump
VLNYLNTYLTSWLGQVVIRDMRKQVFSHILRLRLSFFDKTPVGRLQTRAISDIETLNDVFTSGLVQILGQLFLIAAIMGFMFFSDWRLTLVVLSVIPLMFFATWIFKNHIKKAFQGVRDAVSNMNSFLQEHITGMQIVHIFSREKVEAGKFDKINRNLRKAHLNSVLAYSIYFPVIEVITALAMALLVWYGAGRALEGLKFGTLTAFIMYLNMFFRPLRQIADQFNTLQLGMVSAERVFKVLDTEEFIVPPEERDEEPPLPTGDSKEAIKGIPVTFDQVSFAYQEPNWVLQDINISVKAGDKVALVGSTGSGKTTIISLLSRFYEIQKGSITVGEKDIKAYSLEELRSLIGVVLQDVFLFSGSIRDNITLNNDAIPFKRVVAAAEQVGAHQFIARLPGAYDYKVQERGSTLSLGQRQLLAFARVMVYDPKILVLDEATANIDTESEEIIQRAIETVMSGRTSIIIAHRLSTIQKADQIIVLQKGRVLESGNHQQLLAQKGAYYKLHEMQFVEAGG